MIELNSALILIDLQNDFCPGGALAVPNGDDVIAIANRLQPAFPLVVASQDWHPEDHVSFAINHPGKKVGDLLLSNNTPQILWPAHCTQGSRGAELHPALIQTKINQIFYKGADKNIDSFSAFFDNEHKHSTGLDDYLRAQAIENVYLLGLATEYCVKYSSLDAVALGFNVFVIEDACRGVELQAGDIEAAYAEMKVMGVKLIQSADILKAS